jgi:tetrahydromethanopterin S-methyltransferase subunit H
VYKLAFDKLKNAPTWMWFVITLTGIAVEAYTARMDTAAVEAAAATAAAESEAATKESTAVRELGSASEHELAEALRDTQVKASQILAELQTKLAQIETKLAVLEVSLTYMDRDVDRLLTATGTQGIPTVSDVRAMFDLPSPETTSLPVPEPITFRQVQTQYQE